MGKLLDSLLKWFLNLSFFFSIAVAAVCFGLSIDAQGYYTPTTLAIPVYWSLWIFTACIINHSGIFSLRVKNGFFLICAIISITAAIFYALISETGGASVAVWAFFVSFAARVKKIRENEPFRPVNADGLPLVSYEDVEEEEMIPLPYHKPITKKEKCAKCCGGFFFVLFSIFILLATLDCIQRSIVAFEIKNEGHFVHVEQLKVDIFWECRGTGSPTVVFEPALGVYRKAYRTQFFAVANTTRACWYDRPGYGRSNNPPGRSDVTFSTISESLWEILNSEGERGPFVLVAHSLGGPMVRTFALQHTANVSGLFLMDTSSEDMAKHDQNGVFALLHLLSPLSFDMWLVPSQMRKAGLAYEKEDLICYANDRVNKAAWREWVAADHSGWAALRQLRDAKPSLGSIPMTILTAGDTVQSYSDEELQGKATAILDLNATLTADGTYELFNVTKTHPANLSGWIDLQRMQIAPSSDNYWELLPGTSHFISNDRPTLVTDRILKLIARARRYHQGI